MDDNAWQTLIDFSRDALRKGYNSDYLKKMMLNKGISESETNDIIRFAQFSVISVKEPAEDTFVPRLIVFLSLAIMVFTYVIKIVYFRPPQEEFNLGLRILIGFWPVAFPILANLINLVWYRKSFGRGFFITFVATGLLVLLVIVLAKLGL